MSARLTDSGVHGDGTTRISLGGENGTTGTPGITATSGTDYTFSNIYTQEMRVYAYAHHVKAFFTYFNNTGSTMTLKITFNRSNNGSNFGFDLDLIGEYPGQAHRAYKTHVATTSGDGSIFSSQSREYNVYQSNLGSWSCPGNGTNPILWQEQTYLAATGTYWGAEFTFKMGHPYSSSYDIDSINFTLV